YYSSNLIISCLRALCIQSHVVHGSVIEPHRGQVLDANDLKELYLGLKTNGLHRYTHVLTGYVGSPSFLEGVAYIVSDLKNENPGLKFYCDPVLGDRGKLLCFKIFTLERLYTLNYFLKKQRRQSLRNFTLYA
ncbi:unnamed protein product, partial [Trichobilharzia regenti]